MIKKAFSVSFRMPQSWLYLASRLWMRTHVHQILFILFVRCKHYDVLANHWSVASTPSCITPKHKFWRSYPQNQWHLPGCIVQLPPNILPNGIEDPERRMMCGHHVSSENDSKQKTWQCYGPLNSSRQPVLSLLLIFIFIRISGSAMLSWDTNSSDIFFELLWRITGNVDSTAWSIEFCKISCLLQDPLPVVITIIDSIS